jgi:hypothetical protein
MIKPTKLGSTIWVVSMLTWKQCDVMNSSLQEMKNKAVFWDVYKCLALTQTWKTIDYGAEDGRFPVYAICVTTTNPDSRFSSETGGFNPGIKSWKSTLLNEVQCQEAIGGIDFTKKRRAETPQPGLEFDNFKPRLEIGSSLCISWQEGLYSPTFTGRISYWSTLGVFIHSAYICVKIRVFGNRVNGITTV